MKLVTRSFGNGPKQVALLHGISAQGRLFADLTELLVAQENYTVIEVDLRGHGDSDRSDDYSLARFSEDVIETLPTGLDAIVGHSLGGRILLDSVAAMRPKRAVYLDPAIAPVLPSDVTNRSNVGEHPDGTAYSLDELRTGHPLWGETNLARVQDAHRHWDPRVFEQLTLEAATLDPDAATPRPIVPSLLLRGAESPLIDDAFAGALVRSGWEVRTQPGAGHNVHLDDVDLMLRSLAGWL